MTSKTHVMVRLCKAIIDSGKPYDASADLPAPNLYLCSVYPLITPKPFDSVHINLSADYTGLVMQKVSNFMADKHNFRTYRSNSTIKVRRLKLGDVIQNPEAYLAALLNAKAANESDIVTALRKLPLWVSAATGVPIPDVVDADSVWSRLCDAISPLRPAL